MLIGYGQLHEGEAVVLVGQLPEPVEGAVEVLLAGDALLVAVSEGVHAVAVAGLRRAQEEPVAAGEGGRQGVERAVDAEAAQLVVGLRVVGLLVALGGFAEVGFLERLIVGAEGQPAVRRPFAASFLEVFDGLFLVAVNLAGHDREEDVGIVVAVGHSHLEALTGAVDVAHVKIGAAGSHAQFLVAPGGTLQGIAQRRLHVAGLGGHGGQVAGGTGALQLVCHAGIVFHAVGVALDLEVAAHIVDGRHIFLAHTPQPIAVGHGGVHRGELAGDVGVGDEVVVVISRFVTHLFQQAQGHGLVVEGGVGGIGQNAGLIDLEQGVAMVLFFQPAELRQGGPFVLGHTPAVALVAGKAEGREGITV